MNGDRNQAMSTSTKANLFREIIWAWPIAAVVLVSSLIMIDPVVGQMIDEGVRQDNVERLESARPILEYIIAGVCIFGSLAIGFKSSNRAAGT